MTDLAQRAVVREAERQFFSAVIDRIVAGGPIAGSREEPHQAAFRVLEAMKAELPAYRAAVLADLRGSAGLDFEGLTHILEYIAVDYCGLCASEGDADAAEEATNVLRAKAETEIRALIAAKEAAWREEHERLAQKLADTESLLRIHRAGCRCLIKNANPEAP